jgi:hypothetical protein
MRKILVLAVAVAVVWAAGAMAFTPKPRAVVRDDITILKQTEGPLPKPFLVSPGYGVGTTDYDWFTNGSIAKTIVRDGLRGVHFYWTYRTGGVSGSRRGYYNFKDETGAWLGEIAQDSRVGRFGSMAVLSDGRACPSAHVTGSAAIFSSVAIDAARGAGAFNPSDIDTANPAGPNWPHVAAGGSDVIHVIGSAGDFSPPHYYSRSTNQGTSWSTWTQISTGTPQGVGANTITARGTKVAVVWPDSSPMDVWYRESTDNGATWGASARIHQLGAFQGFVWQDAMYSPSGELNVVFDAIDTTSPGGNNGGFRAQIRHWSPSTGETVVRDGNWITQPGWNHGTVACPSIGYQASANRWWCTWVEFTVDDTSAAGFANGEVWAAYSSDGGATWRGHRNLTNSPTPRAPAGQCADDRYQSLAEVVDDTLRVFYLSSFDGGSSEQTEGTRTQDTVRYYQTPATVGVEEFSGSEKAPASFELGASRPNPTGAKTAIQYSLPAAVEVNLSVYNAAGQLVETLASGHRAAGVHTANWEAKSAPAGVYFYRLTAGTFTRTRSMVVVR